MAKRLSLINIKFLMTIYLLFREQTLCSFLIIGKKIEFHLIKILFHYNMHNKVGEKSYRQKEGFNLSHFYQDLHRIQNSLKKGHERKSINSLNKKTKNKYQSQNTSTKVAILQKQIGHKDLLLNKNHCLDLPKKELKIVKTASLFQGKIGKHNGQSLQNQLLVNNVIGQQQNEKGIMQEEQDKLNELSQYKFYESKLLNFKNKKQHIKTLNHLQRTKETPSRLFQRKHKTNNTNSHIIIKLKNQLVKRNEIYQYVQKNIMEENGQIKQDKNINLAATLQLHFQNHQKMKLVIDLFKRVCELQTEDLNILHSFLKQGANQSESIINQSL